MNEQKDGDYVTLLCSVSIPDVCRHKVKWVTGTDDIKPYGCSTSMRLPASDVKKLSYDKLKCEVTDGYNQQVQQFTFSTRSSGDIIINCF